MYFLILNFRSDAFTPSFLVSWPPPRILAELVSREFGRRGTHCSQPPEAEGIILRHRPFSLILTFSAQMSSPVAPGGRFHNLASSLFLTLIFNPHYNSVGHLFARTCPPEVCPTACLAEPSRRANGHGEWEVNFWSSYFDIVYPPRFDLP